MAKAKAKYTKTEQTTTKTTSRTQQCLINAKNYLQDVLCNHKYLSRTCWGLIILEVFLNWLILQNVKYTEIDWIAYMQEVEGFLNGTLDYKLLRGNTGPLVYPAGFLYIYSGFYLLTSQGRNIHVAQYLFLAVYIAQLYFVYKIYCKTAKVPPYALIISTLTSYRIHSIYVLRLFNDPVAVLLFYIALNLFLSNRWVLGSIFYSLAVSVKMNILLYAPCLLTVYLTNLTLAQTFINLVVCGAVQLVLGLPFLYVNPWSYVERSFDIGRIFEHKWTVNYRFLSKDLFQSRQFHIGLLILHVSLLLTFLPLFKKYLSSYARLDRIARDLQGNINSRKNSKTKVSRTKSQNAALGTTESMMGTSEQDNINFDKDAQLMVLPFFVTNLIGVACARSLHYQFYSWYFHSLLYLTFCTGYQKPLIFLLLSVIELCWNIYPSTELSSIALHMCHAILLVGIYKYMKK